MIPVPSSKVSLRSTESIRITAGLNGTEDAASNITCSSTHPKSSGRIISAFAANPGEPGSFEIIVQSSGFNSKETPTPLEL
eukprot:CAMPEP_0178531330 /NCGR_PEP_ID=MMETSP0696-20121128/33366_1 /TAXON_ID=265572 /ORGANISM="Extubocellulus spinifer, Strain CCMP396" /LENGTH=80 /DNA_ID=CAMNT_0020163219 /DNA_START=209 /DNA_END=451 /DNA_ORIENTATION=+